MTAFAAPLRLNLFTAMLVCPAINTEEYILQQFEFVAATSHVGECNRVSTRNEY